MSKQILCVQTIHPTNSHHTLSLWADMYWTTSNCKPGVLSLISSTPHPPLTSIFIHEDKSLKHSSTSKLNKANSSGEGEQLIIQQNKTDSLGSWSEKDFTVQTETKGRRLEERERKSSSVRVLRTATYYSEARLIFQLFLGLCVHCIKASAGCLVHFPFCTYILLCSLHNPSRFILRQERIPQQICWNCAVVQKSSLCIHKVVISSYKLLLIHYKTWKCDVYMLLFFFRLSSGISESWET